MPRDRDGENKFNFRHTSMVSSVVDVVDKRSTSYQATMALAEDELYGAWDGDNGTTAYLMMANADNLREHREALQDRAYSVDETNAIINFIVNTRSNDGGDSSDPMVGPSVLSATAASDAANDAAMTAPRTDREANSRPDRDQWAAARAREFGGLSAKNVFTWVRRDEIPPGSKILTTRYVYNFKVDENNVITSYKARLVVRGFEARFGLEYYETFSGTVKQTTIRTIMSLAAHERLRLHQFDVEQAFLTAKLDDGEAVFVHPPSDVHRPGMVWRLDKALYGLKQASHLFEKHFANLLTTVMGLERLKCDAALYMMTQARGNGKPARLIVCFYVDDLIVAYSDKRILDSFRAALMKKIGIKDIGELKFCLGMHVHQEQDFTVTINQSGFVKELLGRTNFGAVGTKSRKTPLPLSCPDGRKPVSLADCPSTPAEIAICKEHSLYEIYRSVIGSLMYLTGATRPDIGYAVNLLARYVANPGLKHCQFLEHLLRYLVGTHDLGIRYCGNRLQGVILEQEKRDGLRRSSDDPPNPELLSESFRNNVVSYADSDFATDEDTRRSTSGWCTFMNGGPLSWRVKRQATVAASTTEAELYSLADCMKEVKWLQMLLAELGFPQPAKTPGSGGLHAVSNSKKNSGSVIFEDNMGCLQVSQNRVYHQRTKHIDVQWFFALQYVEDGLMCVAPVSTEHQVADLLTKGVGGVVLLRLRPKLMGTWYCDV